MKEKFETTQGRTHPLRTCLGCRAKRPKREMYRLVCDEAGRLDWDVRQARPGRGAYICKSHSCWTAALGRGRLNRAFRRAVDLELIKTAVVPWE